MGHFAADVDSDGDGLTDVIDDDDDNDGFLDTGEIFIILMMTRFFPLFRAKLFTGKSGSQEISNFIPPCLLVSAWNLSNSVAMIQYPGTDIGNIIRYYSNLGICIGKTSGIDRNW